MIIRPYTKCGFSEFKAEEGKIVDECRKKSIHFYENNYAIVRKN